MFSFRKSFGRRLRSGGSKTSTQRPKPRLEVERLEDLILLSPIINLSNAYFALNFAGDDAQLWIANEISTGQFTAQFKDFKTGLVEGGHGQLTATNTMQNGNPVNNLVFNTNSVTLTATVNGTGLVNGNPFGNDQLSGSGAETNNGKTVAKGAVTGLDDPIQAKYQALGGAKGFLGYPLARMDHGIIPVVIGELPTPYGGGFYEQFDGGNIYWSAATGAHEVHGDILTEYAVTALHEGIFNKFNYQKILGLPTSDEIDVPGFSGAKMNTFQGGNIYWSAATGAHEVHGDILTKYVATAHEFDSSGTAVQKILGLPTSDQLDVGKVLNSIYLFNPPQMNTFQGGTIYWSKTYGTHAVYGPIASEYFFSAGGPHGYGLPTSDAQNVLDGQLLPKYMVQDFMGGKIYYSAYGAHTVYGAIETKYESLGGPSGSLGLPTDDQKDVPGVAGARMNTFENGNIYWSPSTGAQVVWAGPYLGALQIVDIVIPASDHFLETYNNLGGPASYLGLPTGDEQPLPDGYVWGGEQYFQGGKIVWTLQDGTYAVKAVDSMGRDWIFTGTGGTPVGGDAHLTVNSNGDYHFWGHFHDGNSPASFNDSLVVYLISPSGHVWGPPPHSGHMAGWFENGSADDYWDASGNDAYLKANWQDFWGSNIHEDPSLSLDLTALVNQIETVAGLVLAIVGIMLTGHTTDGQGAHPGNSGNPPPGGQAALGSVRSPQGGLEIPDRDATGATNPIASVVGVTEHPLLGTDSLMHRDFLAHIVQPFHNLDLLAQGLLGAVPGGQA